MGRGGQARPGDVRALGGHRAGGQGSHEPGGPQAPHQDQVHQPGGGFGVTRVAELRELPDEQLIERLESYKEELFNLRFQLATGQLDNPMRIKDVRHDVSRILTVLRERQPEQEVEEELARADAEALAQSRSEERRVGKGGSGGWGSEE